MLNDNGWIPRVRPSNRNARLCIESNENACSLLDDKSHDFPYQALLTHRAKLSVSLKHLSTMFHSETDQWHRKHAIRRGTSNSSCTVPDDAEIFLLISRKSFLAMKRVLVFRPNSLSSVPAMPTHRHSFSPSTTYSEQIPAPISSLCHLFNDSKNGTSGTIARNLVQLRSHSAGVVETRPLYSSSTRRHSPVASTTIRAPRIPPTRNDIWICAVG